MIVPHPVADVLKDHVVLDLECIDRMYLNVYQPQLQTPPMVYRFLRHAAVGGSVSSKYFQAMTQAFVQGIEDYAAAHGVPIRPFEKGERKDDVAAEFRRSFAGVEGVLFIGHRQAGHGRRTDSSECTIRILGMQVVLHRMEPKKGTSSCNYKRCQCKSFANNL